MRAVIHSEKHYFQMSIFNVAGTSITSKVPLKAVAIDAKNDVFEVTEGAVVKAIYLELWVRSEDTTATSSIITLEKAPGIATANMSAAQSAALGDYPNKKNIFYTTMGLINDQDADAIPVFRGWIKIPKSKQRFGLGDAIRLNIHANTTVGLNVCGFFTYKEYN